MNSKWKLSSGVLTLLWCRILLTDKQDSIHAKGWVELPSHQEKGHDLRHLPRYQRMQIMM